MNDSGTRYWRDQTMLARAANESLRNALRDALAIAVMAPRGTEREALELIADRIIAEGVTRE